MPVGIPALDAAGSIHTDFIRGFIRAEVIHYNDLVRCGSVPRDAGRAYSVRRARPTRSRTAT